MQYDRNPPLHAGDLAADPLAQLELWLGDARSAGMIEPGAMTLATCDAAGAPSARVVLYKGQDDGRICFYTNYESRKGQELAARPQAALVFWWDRLERSVRIEGGVERLSREASARYFHSRPRESQLAAYTSRQSQVVADRAGLDARMESNRAAFEGREVPLPDSWGGYGLRPRRFEFWQGRRSRFHDRVVYRRDDGHWTTERLEP